MRDTLKVLELETQPKAAPHSWQAGIDSSTGVSTGNSPWHLLLHLLLEAEAEGLAAPATSLVFNEAKARVCTTAPANSHAPGSSSRAASCPGDHAALTRNADLLPSAAAVSICAISCLHSGYSTTPPAAISFPLLRLRPDLPLSTTSGLAATDGHCSAPQQKVCGGCHHETMDGSNLTWGGALSALAISAPPSRPHLSFLTQFRLGGRGQSMVTPRPR